MICALAMSYGNPSIKKALEKLREQNCKKLLILPMYPQYSATTVASVFDEVSAQLRKWRWIPELRFINQSHDEEMLYCRLLLHVFPFSARKNRQELINLAEHLFCLIPWNSLKVSIRC